MTETTQISPPVARKEEKITEKHGVQLRDDYFWLRDKESEEVIDYLKAENTYTDKMMEHTEHNAISEQNPDGPERKQRSHDERKESDLNIIHRNPQKHVDGVHLFVNRQRIVILDVFEGHIHIRVSQNQPHETIVVYGGKNTDQNG